jgi:hypothetical protein
MSWFMDGTYVSSISINYDVLLEAYLLDVLVMNLTCGCYTYWDM